MAPSCHHTDPNRSDSMCVLLSFLTFFDYSHCIRHGMPRILFDLIVRFWIQLNDVSGGTKSPTVKIFTAQNKENKQKRFQDITKWQYVTIWQRQGKHWRCFRRDSRLPCQLRARLGLGKPLPKAAATTKLPREASADHEVPAPERRDAKRSEDLKRSGNCKRFKRSHG